MKMVNWLRRLSRRMNQTLSPKPRRRDGAMVHRYEAAEVLESRALLSAVTASFAAGTLTLTGDTGNHDLSIFRDAQSGQLRVQGNNGTQITLNGQTSSSFQFNVTTSLFLNLANGNGNDSVSLDGSGLAAFAGTVNANLGGGSNSIALKNFTANAGVSVAGGNGGDQVTLQSVTTNSSSVITGEGNDTILVAESRIQGPLSVFTAGGSDSVTVQNRTIGTTLTIDTGARGEADSVFVSNSSASGLTSISTGGGNDTVTQSGGNLTGGLQVLSGDGDDHVLVLNANVGTLLTILSGNGNDVVDVSEVLANPGVASVRGSLVAPVNGVVHSVDGPTTIDTGAGSDQIHIARMNFNSTVLLSTGVDSDSNTISIDDAVFKGAVTAQTFGPNNVINVEKNTALVGNTDFQAAVTMAMYGASGRINLGNSNDTINRIRFGGSVLFVGGNPQTVVRYTAAGTTFTQQPTLINARLENIDVFV